MAFTKYYNEILGIVLVLSALLSTASAVDCHGKSFHCVNSTHFMICVDLGGGVSQSIDNFYISCPLPTVCQGTNHFECEFPVSTTPSTLPTKISETTASWDEVVTDTLPPGNTTKEFSEKYMNTESITTAVENSFTTDATVDITTATTLDLSINNELNIVDNKSNVQDIAPQTLNINKSITEMDPIATAKDLATTATDVVMQNTTETVPVVGKQKVSSVIEMVTGNIPDNMNITEIEPTVTTEVQNTIIDMMTQNETKTNKTTDQVPVIAENSANIDNKNFIEISSVPIAVETTTFPEMAIQSEYIATTTDKLYELQTINLNTLPTQSIDNHTLKEELYSHPRDRNKTGPIQNVTPNTFNTTHITNTELASTSNDVNETSTDISLKDVVSVASTSTSEPTLATPHIKVDQLNSVNISRPTKTGANYEGKKQLAINSLETSITSGATIMTTDLPYPDLTQNGASQFIISDTIPPLNIVTTEKHIEVETTTIDESFYGYNTESQTEPIFNEVFLDHTTANYTTDMLKPQNPLEKMIIDGALLEGTVNVDNNAAAGKPKTIFEEITTQTNTTQNIATEEPITPTSQTEYPSITTSETTYLSSAYRDQPVWTTFDTLVTEPTLLTTNNIGSEINSATSVHDLIKVSNLEEISTQFPDDLTLNGKHETTGIPTDTYIVPLTDTIQYNFETEQTTESVYINTTASPSSHSTGYSNIDQNKNQIQDHTLTSGSDATESINGIYTFETTVTDSFPKILNSSKESSKPENISIISEDKVIETASPNAVLNINEVSNVSETTSEGYIVLLPANLQNTGTENVPGSVLHTTNQNSIGQQGETVIDTETHATTTIDPPTKTNVGESQNIFISTNGEGDSSQRNIYSTPEIKFVSPITNDSDIASTTNVDNIIISDTVTYQPALVDNVHRWTETVAAPTVTERYQIFGDVVASSKLGVPTVPLTDLTLSTGSADITTQSYKAGADVDDLAVHTVNSPPYYAETGAIDRVSDTVKVHKVGAPTSKLQSGITDETNDVVRIHTSPGGLTNSIVEGLTISSQATDAASSISTVLLVREPTFDGQTGASDLSNDVTKPYTAGDSSIKSKPGATDAASGTYKDVTTYIGPIFNAQPGVIDMTNSVTKPNTAGDLLLNLGSDVTDTNRVTVPTAGESALNVHTRVDDIFSNGIKSYSDGDISIHSQSGATSTPSDITIDALVEDSVYNGQTGVTYRPTVVGNVLTVEGITIDQSGVSDTTRVVNMLPAQGGSTLNDQTNFPNDAKKSSIIGDVIVDSQLGVIGTSSDSTTVSIAKKPDFNAQEGVTERSTDTGNAVENLTVKSESRVGDAAGIISAPPVHGSSTFNAPTSVADTSSDVTKVNKVGEVTFNLQLGETGAVTDRITAPIIESSTLNIQTEKSIVTAHVGTVDVLTIKSQSEVATVVDALHAAAGSTFDTIVADSSSDVTKPYRAGDFTTNSPSQVTGAASDSITVAIVERPTLKAHTEVTEKIIVSANKHNVADEVSVIGSLPVHGSSTFNVRTGVADSSSDVTNPYRTEELTTNTPLGVTGVASNITTVTVDGKATSNSRTVVTDNSVTANLDIAEGLSIKSQSVVGDAGSVTKALSAHESPTVNSPTGITDRASDVTYKVRDATKDLQTGGSNTASDITTISTGRPTPETQKYVTQRSSVVTKDYTSVGGTIILQSGVTNEAKDMTRAPVTKNLNYNSQTGLNDKVNVNTNLHTVGISINTQSGVTVGVSTSTSPEVETPTFNSQMGVRDTTSSVTNANTVTGSTYNSQSGMIDRTKNIKTVNLIGATAVNAQTKLAIDTKVEKIVDRAIDTQSTISLTFHAKPLKSENNTIQDNPGTVSRNSNSTTTQDSSYISQNTSLNVEGVPQKLPGSINVQRELPQRNHSIANVTVPSTIQTLTVNKVSSNKAPHVINNHSKQTSNNTSPSASYTCVNKIRGRYSDKDDCRKFYICVGSNQPIVGYCPENTVFSDLKKLCTKNMSHCIRDNQFKCPSAGRFSDFLNDNVYYICVNHKNYLYRFKFQCQKGYILNKTTVKCIETREIESNESASISDNSAQSGSSDTTSSSNIDNSNSNTSKSKEAPEKPEEKKEKDEDDVLKCEKEGKFPVRNDCRRYYLCKKNGKSEYRRKVKKCESGEIFHKIKKKCVDDDSYEC